MISTKKWKTWCKSFLNELAQVGLNGLGGKLLGVMTLGAGKEISEISEKILRTWDIILI